MPQVINSHISLLKLRFLSFLNLNCNVAVFLNSVLSGRNELIVSKGCEVVIFILTVRKKSNWLVRSMTLHTDAIKWVILFMKELCYCKFTVQNILWESFLFLIIICQLLKFCLISHWNDPSKKHYKDALVLEENLYIFI